MTNTKSIMIVGVGGQGSLLASKTLGRLLMNAGYDVKVSEVHGMSQRGGSVVTYVRYGQRVCSPVFQTGEADVLLSFELCEAARWSGYLKKDGVLITSTQQIMPMPVITGAAQYPADLEKNLRAVCSQAYIVDALTPAEKAGSSKAVNVVLLGLLSKMMDLPEDAWKEALKQCVKPQFLEMNLKAFQLGRELYNV